MENTLVMKLFFRIPFSDLIETNPSWPGSLMDAGRDMDGLDHGIDASTVRALEIVADDVSTGLYR